MVETTSMKKTQQFCLCPRFIPLYTIEKKSNLRGLGIGYTYMYIKLSAMIITVNDLVVCAVVIVSKTYSRFAKGQQNVDNSIQIFSKSSLQKSL